jgi:hypothetical protein
MVASGTLAAAQSGMAFRQFTDLAGVEWTVYDVVPRADERRASDRRDVSRNGEPTDDERRGDDRRAAIRTSRPVRLTRGWLCFESGDDRRRLQPIPESWNTLPDSELVGLLDQARSAPRRNKPERDAGIGRA